MLVPANSHRSHVTPVQLQPAASCRYCIQGRPRDWRRSTWPWQWSVRYFNCKIPSHSDGVYYSSCVRSHMSIIFSRSLCLCLQVSTPDQHRQVATKYVIILLLFPSGWVDPTSQCSWHLYRKNESKVRKFRSALPPPFSASPLIDRGLICLLGLVLEYPWDTDIAVRILVKAIDPRLMICYC